MVEFAHQFIYMGKKTLDDYHLIIAKYKDEPECPMGLTRSIVGTDITISKPYIQSFSTKYDSPLSFPIMLSHIDGSRFKEKEVADITAWLTSPKTFRPLRFYDINNVQSNIEYMVIFTSVDVVRTTGMLGEIIGLKFKLTCDSSYGYVNCRYPIESGVIRTIIPPLTDVKGDINNDKIIDNLDLILLREHINGDIELSGDITDPTSQKYRADLNGDGIIDVVDSVLLRKKIEDYHDSIKVEIDIDNNTTELEDYVYPIIHLVPYGNETMVKIKNETDNNYVEYKNLNNYQEGIIIDCKNQIIKNQNGKLIPLSSLGWEENSDSNLYKGDINGDGIIDITDLSLLSSHINGDIELSGDITDPTSQKYRADLNGDGIIDVVDSVLLRKKIISYTNSQTLNINYKNSENSIYWPRLLPGNNHIIVYGKCSFYIEYKYPMKVGAI